MYVYLQNIRTIYLQDTYIYLQYEHQKWIRTFFYPKKIVRIWYVFASILFVSGQYLDRILQYLYVLHVFARNDATNNFPCHLYVQIRSIRADTNKDTGIYVHQIRTKYVQIHQFVNDSICWYMLVYDSTCMYLQDSKLNCSGQYVYKRTRRHILKLCLMLISQKPPFL